MISYQTDGIEMPSIEQQKTTEWIKSVAATYQKRVGEIAY
ncbi:MAG: rRNA maturation factor, partial [Bacteroides sp.]|nr:rRNA maturation factor [Bacteroides sp.]